MTRVTAVEPGENPAAPAPLYGDLGYLLSSVLRSYLAATSAVVEGIPGGPRGFHVISAAVTGRVATQAALAELLGINRTVMTYLLDDLEKAGLVSRRLDPNDRRNRHVVATEDGRRLHDETAAALRAVEDEILGALEPSERAALRSLLYRVAGPEARFDALDGACDIVRDFVPAKGRSRA